MNRHFLVMTLTLALAFFLSSCETTQKQRIDEIDFIVPEVEARWIREGESIEFEGEKWYPQDSLDYLRDDEVYYLGDYRNVQFFVEKIDVRPYDRLYTKFGQYQFRVFQKEDYREN